MATLQGTSLINCLYIPDFINSGTNMLFENATAPTSWTKNTTFNNYALRIVNSAVTTGGANPFISVLSPTGAPFSGSSPPSQAIPGGVVSSTTGSTTATVSLSTFNTPSTDQGAAVQAPPHTHGYNSWQNPLVSTAAPQVAATTVGQDISLQTGQGLPHTHTALSGSHSHGGTNLGNHNHPMSGPTDHFHPVTGTAANLAVYYRDVIIASKD